MVMRSRTRGFTLIEVLVVIAILGMLVALLLPAIQKVREAANRMKCQSNLRQAAVAMHTYHHDHGKLPPSFVGCCWGTWVVKTLPYLEQDSLARLYEDWGVTTGRRYSHEPNRSMVCSKRLAVLTCPSDARQTVNGMTSHNYAINLGNTSTYQTPVVSGVRFAGAPFTVGQPLASAALEDITAGDGTSQTLLLAEVVQGINDHRGFSWWGPASGFVTIIGPNSPEPDSFRGGTCRYPHENNPPCLHAWGPAGDRMAARSRHAGMGVNAVLCDGGVRFIQESIHPNVWRALSTTRGGELVSGEW
jgi:prepilin-type N-terminal cleavage/methylation domain-containing protein